MDWKLEDNAGTAKGYLRITCDGEPAADVFPYAKDRDAAKVKDRARYMVETLNASNHQADLIAFLEKVTEHFDREAEGETVTGDPAALYAEGIVCLRRLSMKPNN